MADGKFLIGKPAGGVTTVTMTDGASNTNLVLPESGTVATQSYVDLKQSKSELAYNVDTSSYTPNTLASGAIIERGSNANGEYIKYADGTLICIAKRLTFPYVNFGFVWTFPHSFIGSRLCLCNTGANSGDARNTVVGTLAFDDLPTHINSAKLSFWFRSQSPTVDISTTSYLGNAYAIGCWK